MTAVEQKAFVSQWRIKPAKEKAPKVRSRIWAPKVRTGCRICKQRKLKCDEKRPECARCVKAGFECEYSTPKAWVFESSQSSTSDSQISTPAPDAPRPQPTPSEWSEKLDLNEQRALVYFKERTAPILASFAHGSTQFWTRIIPQMALSNATIRSAMIAASSLHENVHYRARSLRSTLIPEKLYSKHLTKSISALTIRDQPPPRDVVLVTCLLFLACENLKQSKAAHLHVQSGLKVLREWKQANSNTSSPESYVADSLPDVVQNTLEPIFARLEAQLSLTKEPSLSRGEFRSYDLNWDSPVVPPVFPDLFSARDAMHDIVQWYFYQTRLAGGPLLANHPSYHKVARYFSQWTQSFTSSVPNPTSHTHPAWSSIAALRIHHLALTLTLHAEAKSSVTHWDEHISDVQWLLDICEEIITSGPPPLSPHQQDSLWLYDFCLNPPLLLTALNCRHPGMRRKAIDLMRVQHCWNNNESFDACGSAKICEVVLAVEEAGLSRVPATAEDVPIQARIRPLMVWFGTPYRVTLFYDRMGDGAVREKSLNWKGWERPVLDTLFMYPLGEMVKYGQFQGLIRPARTSCMCKTYGASISKEDWIVEG